MAIRVVEDKCNGCGLCAKACPQAAIEVSNKMAIIDLELCNYCSSCVSTCRFRAIAIEIDKQPQEDLSQYKDDDVRFDDIHARLHRTGEIQDFASGTEELRLGVQLHDLGPVTVGTLGAGGEHFVSDGRHLRPGVGTEDRRHDVSTESWSGLIEQAVDRPN